MTAIEAMIHCLGFVSNYPVDGEFQSQCVYDKYGYPHWIAWRVAQGKRAKPLLQSSSDVNPFAEMLEPYRSAEVEKA